MAALPQVVGLRVQDASNLGLPRKCLNCLVKCANRRARGRRVHDRFTCWCMHNQKSRWVRSCQHLTEDVYACFCNVLWILWSCKTCGRRGELRCKKSTLGRSNDCEVDKMRCALKETVPVGIVRGCLATAGNAESLHRARQTLFILVVAHQGRVIVQGFLIAESGRVERRSWGDCKPLMRLDFALLPVVRRARLALCCRKTSWTVCNLVIRPGCRSARYNAASVLMKPKRCSLPLDLML